MVMLLSRILLILCLFAFMQQHNAQTLWNSPNAPVCQPGASNLNVTMFGYSVAVSNGESPDTFMVVGRPWDGTVYIYRANTPQKTSRNIYDSYNGESYPLTPDNYNLPNWELYQTLRDTYNSTFSTALFGLFGYSVDITGDAELIVASSPGKSQTNTGLRWPTNGVIRLFKRYTNTTNFSINSGTLASGFAATVAAPVVGKNLLFNTNAVSTSSVVNYNVTLSNGTVIQLTKNITNSSSDALTFVNVTSVIIDGRCSQPTTFTSANYVTSYYVNVTCTANLTLSAPGNITFNPGVSSISTNYTFISAGTTGASVYPSGFNISGATLVKVGIQHLGYELVLNSNASCVAAGGYVEDICYFKSIMIHEKFGSKVMFSKDANATYLFVVGNHGWEGVNSTFTQTSPWSKDILYKDTTTERLGVSVFKRIDGQSDYSRLQFLNATTPHPLGTLGLDIATVGSNVSTMALFVRDYYPNGNEEKPGGQVIVYTLSNNSTWQRKSTLSNEPFSNSNWRNEDWFGRGISAFESVSENIVVAGAGAPRHALWFSLFYANRTVLYNVSTQREASYIKSSMSSYSTMYVSYPTANQSSSPFDYAQIISNPNYQARNSFFGGTSAFSSTGDFLFIADASNSNWNGRVYIYRRYNSSESVFGIPTVPSVQVTYGSGNFTYYYAAEMVKTKTANYTSLNNADWFGNAIASNWWCVVVSAAVESCIHTYPMPQVYTNPELYFTSTTTISTNVTSNETVCSGTLYSFLNHTSNLNSTMCCQGNETVVNDNGNYLCHSPSLSNNGTSDAQTSTTSLGSSAQGTSSATAGIVAAVVALVVVIPATWYGATYLHKRSVLKRLERELTNALDLRGEQCTEFLSTTATLEDHGVLHTMFSERATTD